MKMVKRILSLFIVCAMLTVSAAAAFPTGITIAEINPIIPDNSYGIVWSNDFEFDTSHIPFGDSSTKYTELDFGDGFMTFNMKGADPRQRLEDMGDDYHGQAFTGSLEYADTDLRGTKSFASDISGKKFNFSTQIKMNTFDISNKFNAFRLNLYNDGTQLKSNIETGDGTDNLLRVDYDTTATQDGWQHSTIGMFSRIYKNGQGAYVSGTSIGLDDTDWHQLDVTVDADTKTMKFFLDGAQIGEANTLALAAEGTNILDANGNLTFDKIEMFVRQQATNSLKSYTDNFMITKLDDSASKFGVKNVKIGTDAVYVELSATVAAGQAAPAITLKKVGSSTFVAPTVSFEGSQAIKLDLSDVTLDANSEYQIVYPNDISLVDINGRGIDKAQTLTIYNDGAGNGATSARLVNASGVKIIPDGKAMANIAGLEITFEEELTSPVYEFTADGDKVTVSASHVGSTYNLSWDEISAEGYNLTIKDGETVVYSYVKADIAEINPIIPDNSYGIVWSNDFEFDTSHIPFGDSSTKYTELDFGDGFMTFNMKGADPRQRLENMVGDDYHGQAFTGSLEYADTDLRGTKSFASDISGKKFNFSTQIKMNTFDISNRFNAFRLNLYNDGTQLKSNIETGDGTDNLLRVDYDTTATQDGWQHSTIGMFSRIYKNGQGAYVSGTSIGLDDTDWHQLDVTVDADTKTMKFFLDGAQIGEANTLALAAEGTNILDANGNLTFDKIEMFVRQQATNSLKSYTDNFMITKLDDSASKFGVKNVKIGTDAVYAELSATAAAGQTAPEVTLRKVGTDTVITPSAVTFEGSQALKISATGLEADTEYEIVYPEGMTFTDINGRSIDKAQIVTFYNDGAGSGVKSARLVNLDNTLAAPVAAPANSIKGIMLTLEEACTNLSATLKSVSDPEPILTKATGSDDEWIVGWSEFLANTEHTLTVAADGVTVFTYVFTPELGDELSISEFALYDADGNEIKALADVTPGETLIAKATIINPTGEDRYATLLYATYYKGYLKSVACDQNEGKESIGSSFTGDKLEVEVPVPASGCDEISIFLWERVATMKPLMDKIEIAE